MNPLKRLREHGQSVWFDYIRRNLMTSGELERLIERDGLRGMTSNPAIFQQALAAGEEYAEQLRSLSADRRLDAKSIYERLAIEDIRQATAILWPVYEETDGLDGYVSLEVSPHLAHGTEATIDEARRLWRTVERPNLMIKVPATPAGIPAIERLIGEGINVNVTLLFDTAAYERAALAYMRGLEAFGKRGGDLRQVASVASFFISRLDSAIDALVADRLGRDPASGDRAQLESLLGRVAVANAKLAFERGKELHGDPRWAPLAAQGARPQRLLWASTGTKNAAYSDVLYVEPLIGPDTVNTLPPSTYDAFREHGEVATTVEDDLDGAHEVFATMERLGIDVKEIMRRLLDDGVGLFADAFDTLLGEVETAVSASSRAIMQRQTYRLPRDLATRVDAALDDWQRQGNSRRLWAGDTSLWSGADEARWLGWLDAPAAELEWASQLRGIAEDVRQAGFTHAMVLGMGGSSLCPEVLALTFGRSEGYPQLHVLDSTDPAQVKTFEQRLDLARTLFIVASKSGSTLEPNIFKQYFWQRVCDVVGAAKAGRQFVAITDPGSSLQEMAERENFRRVFFGQPTIGGRFSALSNFGMVPAAVMGLDCTTLLERADIMAGACAACVPARDNPGVVLGTILGVAARAGRDKLTVVTSPGISGLGAWLEQLVAESTGKQGQLILLLDGEYLGPPQVYGDDRLFIYVRLETSSDATQDAALDALARAGQPVVTILMPEPIDLGGEFYRWEIATAVAGAHLGINPFDQPDVEASKLAMRTITRTFEETGALPAESPLVEENGLTIYADEANAAVLAETAGGGRNVAGYLKAHLDRLQPGDYFALLAYLEMSAAHRAALQSMRHAVRDARQVATSLGFGPRFLHSTGQGHKGGPDTGVFLQLTCDDAADVDVPGQAYSFGVVKAAQARGDLQVLAERGRRAIRVHLGSDVAAGLARLREMVAQAVGEPLLR